VTLSDHPYGAAIGDGLLSQAAPQRPIMPEP
jgi:hypothetical protein